MGEARRRNCPEYESNAFNEDAIEELLLNQIEGVSKSIKSVMGRESETIKGSIDSRESENSRESEIDSRRSETLKDSRVKLTYELRRIMGAYELLGASFSCILCVCM